MKIVQTFWSGKQTDDNLSSIDLSGGWLSAEYHWMSWAFSCLQLRRFYDEVELITDEVGKSILIDQLKLPYTSVSTALEGSAIRKMPSQLWAMAKIYSYGLQDKPFLHIDGDVFIAASLNSSVINAPVVVQNLDTNLNVYHKSLTNVQQNFSFIPQSILIDRQKHNYVSAYNTGILGGHNMNFLKHYAEESYEFIERNSKHLSKVLGDPCFNMITEQYLLFCLAQQNDIPVNCLFDPVNTPDGFNRFIQIESFPQTTHYVHVMGAAKKLETVCNILANLLRQYYPIHYYNVLKHCRAGQIKLSHKAYSLPALDPRVHSADYFQQVKLAFNNGDKNFLERSVIVNLSELPLNSFTSKLFARTYALLSNIIGSNITQIISKYSNVPIRNVIASIIHDSLSIEYKTFVKDCFCYEIRKQICIQKMMPYTWLYARDIELQEQRSKWNSLDIDDLLEEHLIRDEHINVIRTRWNWASYTIKTSSIAEWQELLEQPSQVCYIALLPDIRTLEMSEVLLDDFDYLLLSICKTNQSVRDIIEIVSKYFPSEEIMRNYQSFREMVLSSLYRALTCGFLKLQPLSIVG